MSDTLLGPHLRRPRCSPLACLAIADRRDPMRLAATRPVCRFGFPLLVMALVSAASAPGQALALEITTASLSDAAAGVAYSDAVVAANGTTPYVWSFDSGNLPSGLS